MLILARSVGLYFVVTGAAFLANPASLHRYIIFWSQGKRLYWVGVGRLVSAAILLAAAPVCRFPWVMAVIGGLNILLGIPYFFRGIAGMKAMVAMWEKRPPRAVRILGTASLVLGAIIILCA
ncbi:MAG TPA: hypothetical protein P5110_04450 [Candidatus Omnitrophota bacterium]|nr:hypothetical protein [Candidatus Omnitrophota bacterium]HRZ14742.1 hypothetical protein [Candidatus Omnitrophota bacterium]